MIGALPSNEINNVLFQSTGAGRHFEPQIAMLCPEKGDLANKLFHNKFLSSSGNLEIEFTN